jgi:hypothetical protein
MGTQELVALSHANGTYLAAWTSRTTPLAEQRALFVARFDEAGGMLDAQPLLLSSWGIEPAIATDGNDFLVVWAGDETQPVIRAARVAADGKVLAPGKPITSGPAYEHQPSVAWNGEEYVVVFMRSPGNNERILAVRLDAAANVVSGPIELGEGRKPAVVGVNGQTLVAWANTDPLGIRATRIGAGGTVLDPEGLPITNSSMVGYGSPTAALFDNAYWVVWDEGDHGYQPCSGRMLAARVDPNGVTKPPVQVHKGSDPVCIEGLTPAVTALNAGLYIAYWGTQGIESCLHSLAKPLECHRLPVPNTIHAGPAQGPMASSSAGATALLAYQRFDRINETDADILLARIGSNGAALDATRRPLPPAASSQIRPAVAARPDGGLAVWCDSGGTSSIWHVRAAPIDASGVPGNVEIIGESYGPECWPVVTPHADGYLAAWVNGWDQVLSRRLDTLAKPLEASPVVLGRIKAGDVVDNTSYTREPQLAGAWNGRMSLVVWSGQDVGTTHASPGYSVHAARVSSDGSCLDPNGGIKLDFNSESIAAVGTGEGFLVAHGPITRLGDDGTASEAVPNLTGRSASMIEYHNGFLVSWRSGVGGWGSQPEPYVVQLAELSSQGTVIDGPWTVFEDESVQGVVLGRFGAEAVVAWGTCSSCEGAPELTWNIARLTGHSLGTASAITEGPGARHLAIASTPGMGLLAYDEELPGSGHRVFTRLLP